MKKVLFTEAAKCAPETGHLRAISDAGFKAAELYLSKAIMSRASEAARLCRRFPLRYALHAPNDAHCPERLRELAEGLGARIVVLHDIFWEDEWRQTIEVFKGSRIKLCVENMTCSHDPLKFMRRYGLGRCLDLEHLQLECQGVYEAEFLRIMRQASHIHLTGYTAGSARWHTPVDYSPAASARMLDLLAESGYDGLVVSEAATEYQTPAMFAATAEFFRQWRKSRGRQP
ncbi:MAG: sugar phosphate isomerase/epimerase [Elusimicrobia bacterium]|nr:sugar phosphate isomerase/epimerase [Elusimicrobiota bacterium]